jgi:hypothetical protein
MEELEDEGIGVTTMELRREQPHVVVEGKTTVPFQSFVRLVLQRKVEQLFKEWRNEPLIMNSTLLTSLANAPQESTDDKGKVILTSLILGVGCGIFLSAVILLFLELAGISVDMGEFASVIGIIVVLALLLQIAVRMSGREKRQKLVERVEKISSVIGK